MGLESPLKAEGPVGGKLLFERWIDGWVEAQLLLLVQYGFVQFVHDMYLCATCASCECKTRKCTSYAIFKTALVYFKRTEA